MYLTSLLRVALFVLGLGLVLTASAAEDETWVYGKWELTYDPDGAKKDYIEFMPNGDAVSSGPNGNVDGIYIVDGETVKAVFSWKGKDFIMTFRGDRHKQQLRIVTSRSGKESIYSKIKK
jgi:hypothetical protein